MFKRGVVILIVLLTIFAVSAFLHNNALVPFFVDPTGKMISYFLPNSWASSWTVKILSYITGIWAATASIYFLGKLSALRVLTASSQKFPFILKFPLIGLLIKLLEWKTNTKLLSVVETEDSLFGVNGKWLGLITDEYDTDGEIYCTVYFPSSVSVWTGWAKREIKRSDLMLVEGATMADLMIFLGSFGANDPTLGYKRIKFDN